MYMLRLNIASNAVATCFLYVCFRKRIQKWHILPQALQKHVSITEAPDDTAKSSSRSKVAIVRQTA